MNQISVTILTRNSEKYISEILESLKQFDEIVLCDTGSTDRTIEIARNYQNVVVYFRPFIGFGPTHNVASNLARNDWILSIDSDEVPNSEMIEEVLESTLNDLCVYSFPRDNYYNGKWIKWCGWYPDRQIRLYNRTRTKFTDAQVHEGIVCEGMNHHFFQGSMKHYSYDKVADFLNKMQSYSELFAKQYCNKKKSSLCKAVLHGLFAFFKSYFLKRGFMGGREGFEISVYNANTAFYKYLKLAEFNLRSRFLKTGSEECGDAQKRKLSS